MSASLARPATAFDPAVAAAALPGLRATPKWLPPKLFYDAEGCRLFGEITRLPEYYPTRTELALLGEIAPQVVAAMGPGCALVEYGASDESKARLLLDVTPGFAAYVPIDVAGSALRAVAARLRRTHPLLAVHPVEADFLTPIALPAGVAGLRRAGFFPGSTIGNLDRAEAVRFLAAAGRALGPEAHFLVGVDLQKPLDVLLPAYDDAAGVTAAFNLNVLARLNREADADFDLGAFRHRALWNAGASRIEMHLVSTRAQTVRVAGEPVAFAEGETIHTENSHKYTLDGFADLAGEGGWSVVRVWTDPAQLFSVHLLRAPGGTAER